MGVRSGSDMRKNVVIMRETTVVVALVVVVMVVGSGGQGLVVVAGVTVVVPELQCKVGESFAVSAYRAPRRASFFALSSIWGAPLAWGTPRQYPPDLKAQPSD